MNPPKSDGDVTEEARKWIGRFRTEESRGEDRRGRWRVPVGGAGCRLGLASAGPAGRGFLVDCRMSVLLCRRVRYDEVCRSTYGLFRATGCVRDQAARVEYAGSVGRSKVEEALRLRHRPTVGKRPRCGTWDGYPANNVHSAPVLVGSEFVTRL